MTNDRHERVLRQFFVDEAAVAVPPDLLGRSLARSVTARRRPAWYARMRDVGIARPVAVGMPSLRAGYVLVILGLVVAALFAAVASGAFRRDQVMPLGRNGAIAFSLFEDKQRAGQTSLTYLRDAGGNGDREIATGTCPTFSKDGGTLIYRSNSTETELVAATADGSSPHTLPLTVDNNYRDLSYALSPDGTQVAWFKPISPITSLDGSISGSMNELWVTPVAGGPGVPILRQSANPNESYWLPVWSPDGRFIAFKGHFSPVVDHGPGDRSAVYVIDANGSNLHTLTRRSAVDNYAFGLSWSPDSQYLAYLGLPDGPLPSTASDGPASDPPLDVFVIGADGSAEQNVTNTAAFESRPAWSPDGTRLAYLTSETGEGYRMAVLPMDGRTPVGARILGPESESFTWSPDSSMFLSLYANTIQSVDAGFQAPPTTLVDANAWPQLVVGAQAA